MKAGELSGVPWHGKSKENMLSPSPLATFDRQESMPRSLRTEKLILPLTKYIESRPCTSPVQNKRVDSSGVSAGKLDPSMWEQETWTCFLLSATLGKLVWAVLESPPGGDNKKELEG